MGKKTDELVDLFDAQNVRFQCDKSNNLYVNGKRVVTESKIRLRWFELIIAIVLAASALTQAILAFFHC